MQVPIHRQRVKLFLNYGPQISEGTVNGIFKTLHEQVFLQFYEAIKAYTLESKYLHGDETSWKVFVDKKGKKTFNHWIWVVGSANGITYIYDPSRSKSVVLRTFAPDAVGIINVDRYASYNALPEGIRRAFCWYHLRRDFIRLARGIPVLKKWALKWIKSIRRIERLNERRFEAYSKFSNVDELSPEFIKLHKRLYKLLIAFFARANSMLMDDKLNIFAHKVLTSLIKHWDGYMVFYEYPFVPMHNNASERLLRSIANARNNFLGSRSIWNAELMAMVLSICETAKLHGLNPHTYMEYILAQCSLYEDRQIPDIQTLLPWNINASTLEPYENTQSLIPYIYQHLSDQNATNTNLPQNTFEDKSSTSDTESIEDNSKFKNITESNLVPKFSKFSENDLNSIHIHTTEFRPCNLTFTPTADKTIDSIDESSSSVTDEAHSNVSVPLAPISREIHINEFKDRNLSSTLTVDKTIDSIDESSSSVTNEAHSNVSSFAFWFILIIFYVISSFSSTSSNQINLFSYFETDSGIPIHSYLTFDVGILFNETAVEATFAITKKEFFVGLYHDTS
jgi:hypothetical protein